jgi:hypothetical protein
MDMRTMNAVVIHEPGGPEVLKIETLAVPEPVPGQVLIRVKAFGMNRSELFTRLGYSPDVRFPRVLGIEAVGTVEDALGGIQERRHCCDLYGRHGQAVRWGLCRVHMRSCRSGAADYHKTALGGSRSYAGDASDCLGVTLQVASASGWRYAPDPRRNKFGRSQGGIVCMTGIAGNQWSMRQFDLWRQSQLRYT